MKNITTIIAALTLTLVSANLIASPDGTNTATASSEASVTIIQPISLTNERALNFGVIAASSQDGTVTIDFNGTRTATNGITLPAQFTTESSAQFAVSGEENASFSITLPTSVTIGSGASAMTITDFTENSDNVLSSEEETFEVGATLNVNENQAAGSYSTTFDVTVTYE